MACGMQIQGCMLDTQQGHSLNRSGSCVHGEMPPRNVAGHYKTILQGNITATHVPLYCESAGSMQLPHMLVPAGHTLVVDGGAWLWRAPAVPRELVSKASRGIEASSRTMGLSTSQSKL